MSGITHIGPTEEQTESDYWIEQIYQSKFGKKEEKSRAELALRLKILDELDNPNKREESVPVRRVYNFPESVRKDLAVHDYGKMPFNIHVFPVANSMTILGETEEGSAGINLDFYSRQIKPTQATIFSESDLTHKLRPLTEGFYKNMGELRSPVNLSSGEVYLEDLDRSVRGSYCVDNISFPEKEVSHRELMRAVLQNSLEIEGFSPMQYVISSYLFKIVPSLDEESDLRETLGNLMERVQKVLEDKAAA